MLTSIPREVQHLKQLGQTRSWSTLQLPLWKLQETLSFACHSYWRPAGVSFGSRAKNSVILTTARRGVGGEGGVRYFRTRNPTTLTPWWGVPGVVEIVASDQCWLGWYEFEYLLDSVSKQVEALKHALARLLPCRYLLYGRIKRPTGLLKFNEYGALG